MDKACHQCSAIFNITDDDLDFYSRVSPVFNNQKYFIPPPTLCPMCRMQRRLAWRNDRTFYKRKCDLTGEMFISMYAPDAPFPVYKQNVWHSDRWNAETFGRGFDFQKPFFEQWNDLRNQVPHWGVAISQCQNSDYCNYCTNEKNCYLDIAAEDNENCYYNLFVKQSKDCTDCTFVYSSTLCYECIQCYGCYGCQYSMYLDNCSNCRFCHDCKGCSNCALCINQRGKQYCIMNKQYSKDEYENKIKELNLGSYKSVKQINELWNKTRLEKGIYRDMYNLNCENSTGNDLKNCKNCRLCFNATECEDCKYLYDVLNAKDCYDLNYSLYDPEANCEIISTVGAKFCAFYTMGPHNTNCLYSQMCQSCSFCFGCVGLKHKKYCVLNKQYPKEEYEQLVPRIIVHMKKTDEWGEFFPAYLSPHGYNETVAQEYMPLTETEAREKGFNWKKENETPPQAAKTINASRLPDHISDIPDDVLNWAIVCESSNKPFKVIKQELEFYRSQNIPLPRKSPQQRHKDRNNLRTPRKLWNRTCAKCGSKVQAGFNKNRLEKVVCEKCYLADVY